MAQRNRGTRISLVLRRLHPAAAAAAVHQLQAVNQRRGQLNDDRRRERDRLAAEGRPYDLVILPMVSMSDYLADLIAYTVGVRETDTQLCPSELPDKLEDQVIEALEQERLRDAPPLSTKLPLNTETAVRALTAYYDIPKQWVGADLVVTALQMPEYVMQLTSHAEHALEVVQKMKGNAMDALTSTEALTPPSLLSVRPERAA